ncbi:hypothetical protein CVT26_003279 [Gymnopilus dilepis]|uniref:DUF6535 domain-containing protein n=1 Tax=Gymnopilus dilepis TaxID=231916 RepID=A0A409Y548_9AGAR|nr:hypothetical protein CVT26_003279 [Gymnopilus dilepis]
MLPSFLRKPPKSTFSPDVEGGPPVETSRARGRRTKAEDVLQAGKPSDIDDNDRFWKLYVEEAGSEAKWKVKIWNTELEALLLFQLSNIQAGLFAGVVTAFLLDLRTHLPSDPQLLALREIISFLGNDTSSREIVPTISDRVVGGLWSASLAVTLIGALGGVLAKGWLGQVLREAPNNPVDQALERWRRQVDANHWHFETFITAVPLLTQLALGLFLAGFVVQSLDVDEGIGWTVMSLVSLGAVAYAVATFLPTFFPNTPFQTPLTKLLHLVQNAKPSRDDDTRSKIQVLASRLNRSANDEIFCAAASVLVGKLESSGPKMWTEGVKQAPNVFSALWIRLDSFSYRYEKLSMHRPDLQALTGFSSHHTDPTSNHDVNLYTLTDQGIICLRVALEFMEAGVIGPQDIIRTEKARSLRRWSSSTTFPAKWRFLAWCLNTAALLATSEDDYSRDDIVNMDWESLISGVSSDPQMRSIAGLIAFRGLNQKRVNLRRACCLISATSLKIDGKYLVFGGLS